MGYIHDMTPYQATTSSKFTSSADAESGELQQYTPKSPSANSVVRNSTRHTPTNSTYSDHSARGIVAWCRVWGRWCHNFGMGLV